jgi:beta-lactam-binding protein with PASTA domain
MAINSGSASGPRKNDVPNIIGDPNTTANAKLTAAEFDVRNSIEYTIK